jgi:hypothetical protein
MLEVSSTQKFEAPAQKADPLYPIKVQSNFFRRKRYVFMIILHSFVNGALGVKFK